MKTRLLFAVLATLLLTGCFGDVPPAQDTDTQAKIEQSFRCMWTGDCQ